MLLNHLLKITQLIGFTTNGEFNSLRWKGNSRPLTVLQIKSEVRSIYQRKGLQSLLAMITPFGEYNGQQDPV